MFGDARKSIDCLLLTVISFDYHRIMLNQEKGQLCWQFDCAGSSR